MNSAATTEERGSRLLYDQVVAHYQSCQVERALLSDTWAHTLENKGHVQPLKAMLRMLEIGNPVNFFDDTLYYVDQTVLDLGDPITRELLRLGESDFGHPRRDLRLNGRSYSSNFIHHVVYAAKIIAAVKDRGLARPRVLEIGGGLAGIGYLLRRYFGDRLTYYSVDLPETLIIQEWYLRNCFPDAPTRFKGSADRVEPAGGGLNFINAYMVSSQDLAFDVAINIDSMQEMNRAAIGAYIKYIEKNISPDGLFYFQNHYGQSGDPVIEPSEYPLDDSWTIKTAELSPQIECCSGANQTRLIYYRTRKPENAQTRRLILRLLCNAMETGRISRGNPAIEELCRLPRTLAPADAVPAAEKILRRRGAGLPKGFVPALEHSPYFPHRSFADVLNSRPQLRGLSFQESRVQAVMAAKSELIRLMRDASAGAAPSSLRSGVRRVARDLTALKGTAGSAFWAAYIGSILCALGQNEPAGELLSAAAARCDNPFWLARFAHLLLQCGLSGETARVIERIPAGQVDFFLSLKTAELDHACGRSSSADARLESARSEAGADFARLACLAKTASRLGRPEIAADCCAQIAALFPGSCPSALLSVLRLCADGAVEPAVRRLALELRPSIDTAGDDALLAYGFLLLALGYQEGMALLRTLKARFSRNRDYFRMAWMGKLSMQAGLDDWVEKLLRESSSLRPKAFMHHEFVGNVYFSAGRYAQARACYARALALQPCLRSLLAKQAYCAMPASVRQAEIFGRASDQHMIAQYDLQYYHDLGPASK